MYFLPFFKNPQKVCGLKPPFSTHAQVRHCQYSPDGARILSASLDDTIREWSDRFSPEWQACALLLVHTQHHALVFEGEDGEGEEEEPASPYYFLGCLLHTIANLTCPPCVVDCSSDAWVWA